MDFTDTRSESAAMYSSIGRHAGSLLDIPSSPSARDTARGQNLRAAKSFADLRSYTPSPVPSSASFPVSLRNNIANYQQEYGNNNASTPSLTPTATGNNQDLLVNGLAGMSLTSSMGNLGVGSAGSLRSDPRVMQLERDRRDRDNETGGGIGSGLQTHHGQTVTRSFSMGFDEVRAQRDHVNVIPQRQPRGPDSDRGAGFTARRGQTSNTISGHGGRNGSGELDVQSGAEIVVE